MAQMLTRLHRIAPMEDRIGENPVLLGVGDRRRFFGLGIQRPVPRACPSVTRTRASGYRAAGVDRQPMADQQ